ncbi:MAG: hypoxanthine-guanine phosphoribosyltransferase [Gammaproteobacteria bacterium]|nr:MAG: hypoxanthine-guanine phosphoribosyltransferase [Gammaproteobacteria bacterium]
MLNDISSALDRSDCLYTEAQIASAYDRISENISHDLFDKNPVLLCVMNGGLITTGEILRRIDFLHELDYVHATRYQGGTSGGEIEWIRRPTDNIRGRHVLLVDDILDEGYTLKAIQAKCAEKGAASVHTVVLTVKKHNRRVGGLDLDYYGLEVEDRYIFGCGMDYKGYYRNLPAIYALKQSSDNA